MPLKKPAVSPLATRTMRTAFDNLDQTITRQDSRTFSSMSLKQVENAALEIENQLAARQSLRNMRRLVPLFKGLAHYSRAVEILCNGTPFLPWIWAPITLILQVASEYVEAFEKIVKGYSRIAEPLRRFALLSDAFSTNLDFQQTLAVFYADILQFHKHAYKFVRRNSWTLLFLTSWGRFQRHFDNILEDLKRHEQLVDLQANAQNISEAKQMRESIETWREESQAQLQQLDEKQANKQFESIISWLKADESDQLAIFEATSAEGMKFAGTCSWALKNQRINSWLQQKSDPPVLWLQGTPGSGKSVLITQLIRFMRAKNLFLIQHFCSHRYASSTTYEQILRSLLLQLLRKDHELVAHVYQDAVLGKKPPTVQALERLLYTLFTMTSREPRKTEYVWIVIDGLNECETQKQASVISLINQIISKTSASGETVCKVLISSRLSSHIADRLRMKQIISLTEEKTNLKLAIRQYVAQRLQAFHDKLRQLELGRKEIEDIEVVITNKADGMFLYARLVLDYLSSNIFYSGDEMKESINELPEELFGFYQKILTQILVRLDQRSVDRVKCIFGWIAFTKRPLKKMEFLSALTFSPDESGASKNSTLVPKYAVDICGALVEERPDTTLTFIHISVKEFLQSSSSTLMIDEQEATREHSMATFACLLSGVHTFLENRPEHEKFLRVIKGIHGFHVYATEFWTEYLLHLSSSGEMDSHPRILTLACELAEKLDKISDPSVEQEKTVESSGLDERIAFLRGKPLLQKHVEISLRARSLKRLESKILQEVQDLPLLRYQQSGHGTALPQRQECKSKASIDRGGKDSTSRLLSSYQQTVRFLLEQDHYPGVSADDLELFKSQFRSSAFTCRLNFCPRATTGFTSEELCRQHEIAHTRLAMCTVPECKYPPFVSTQALMNHIRKYHTSKPTRKSIRRVGNFSAGTTISKSDSEIRAKRLMTDDGNVAGSKVIRMRKAKQIKHTQRDTEDAKNFPGKEDVSMMLSSGGRIDHLTEEMHRAQSSSRPNLPLSEANKGPNHDEEIHSGQDLPNDVLVESDLDPSFEVSIDSMGYRGCSIPGCGVKLQGASMEGFHTEIAHHYWMWHHADSMARCAVNRCQVVFDSRQVLQVHYEYKHTTLFCNHCDANHPEGFALEDELRHHWRLQHLKRLTRWVCRLEEVPGRIKPPLALETCNDCVGETKYDRRADVIKHLRYRHFGNNDQTPNWIPLSNLEQFVRETWLYQVEDHTAAHDKPYAIHELESDSEDDSEVIELDEMFYVEELA